MTEQRQTGRWRWAVRSAVASAVRTPGAAGRRELIWKGPRRGRRVAGPDERTYRIFRDTGRRQGGGVPTAVVVAGFTFAWLGRAGSLRHRLFRRVCIVTVPLFSGLAGYRCKLWLYEEGGDRYLGIYEWAGADAARDYVRALVPLLEVLGVRGSVHARVVPDTTVAAYLAAHARSPRSAVAA